MRNALGEALRAEALALGADFFGVADLAPARDFIREQGGEMVAVFPRAVSIGVLMPSAIVDQIVRQDDKRALIAYRSHSYDIINVRLNQIASRLSSFLQREGYRAFPIAAAERGDGETMCGLISHKLAAHLAGLGWIGKSCLLVTPEVGPRVRWDTVLTDASFMPGQPLEERCGDCMECVEVCPAHAFTGCNFRADEPREARYDVFKCNEYLKQREQQIGVRACGLCVYVCPYGRRERR
jgi:epoxyqueuosine reductase QueG